jgi:hypothetical protein
LNGEPVKVRVSAGKARKDGDIFRVPVELRAEGRNAPNVRGEALLADRLPQAPAPAAAPSLAPYSKTVEAAYSEVLFHGPALRLIEAVEGVSPDGLSARLRPAPRPADWMSAPIREGWVTDPGALDAAFQAAILWSCEVLGAPCLPAGLASFKQFASFPAEGFRAILRTARRGESVAVLDIDFVDLAGKLIARVEASEHTVDAGLTRSFKDTVPAG